MMNDSREAGQAKPAGLCPKCANVKIIRSSKGSTFYLCQLSATDPRFPKYPPQPVFACGGFICSPSI